MTIQFAQGQLAKLSARFNYTVLMSVGLLISNILLAGFSGYAVFHAKREVTPFASTDGYVISDSAVDENYLNMISVNLMDARLNVTPETVDQNNALLMQFIASSESASFSQKIAHEAAIIKKDKISSAFFKREVVSNPHNLSTVIQGTLKRWVGYRALPDEEKTYLLTYTYHLGDLKVTSFKEVAPHD